MNAYPYLIAQLDHNWAAGGVQFASAITAPTREDLMRRITEDVALRLFYAALDGDDIPRPLSHSEAEYRRHEAEEVDTDGPRIELAYVGPARLSAHAAAILRCMRAQGLSKTDLARRMGVPRSVVSRLTNLLYIKHSTESLRRAATALDCEIHLRLLPRSKGRLRPRDACYSVPFHWLDGLDAQSLALRAYRAKNNWGYARPRFSITSQRRLPVQGDCSSAPANT